MNLTSSYVQSNEVVKAVDIDYGFDSQIGNVAVLAQSILESTQDFVINGKVKEYGDGSTMNVSISPIFGVSKSSGEPFLNTEVTEPIAIGEGWSVDRIDTIEVKGELTGTTEEQRAFIDFDTKEKTLQFVNTRKEQILNVNVKKNPNDGNVYSTAPATTEGFVKLAEILIPANATSIDECTIFNITSDVEDLENEDWSNEKTRTYNIGYISDVNKRFRTEHEEDGSHAEKVIHNKNIDFGTGNNQVNGNSIPVGQAVSVNGTEYGSGITLKSLILILAEKVTDLFNSYLKNEKYNFDDELSLLKVLTDETDLTKVLTFGANADGTAYIKLKENTILTIQDDKLLVTDNYDASTGKSTSLKELATRAVTNAIWDELTTQTERIDDLYANSDPSSYTNSLFNRFDYIDNVITIATTGNLADLSGLQIVDGLALETGYLILVKDQDDAKENGIYEVNSNNWQRHGDYATFDGIKHKFFVVKNGTVNKNKVFYTPMETFRGDLGTRELNFIEYKKINEQLLEDSAVTSAKLGRDINFKGNPKGNITGNFSGNFTGNFSGTISNLINLVYPIGIVIKFTNESDPNVLLGGAWEELESKVWERKA